MRCKCGFQFAGPGEYMNYEAFVTVDGQSGVVCPDCKQAYVNGIPVAMQKNTIPSRKEGNE